MGFVSLNEGIDTGTPAGPLMLLSDFCYWVFPKPVDFGMLLFDSLGASAYFNKLPELQAVERSSMFIPALSILSSALFGLATLGLASHEMGKRDY